MSLLPPLLAGLLLRLWNLPAQVLGGDELYTVEAALGSPLGQILTTYQLKDPSLPLAGLARLLLLAGLPATEVVFRLPVVLCSLALLVVAPLWARARFGIPVARALAWILALSPALVLYGRLVRPYGAVAFFSFLAVAAFHTWWRSGRSRYGLLYAFSAATSAYFHLGSAPFVLVPLAWAALARGIWRRRGPGLPRLGLVAGLTAAGFAAFLLPAWDSLTELVAGKRNPLEVDLSTLSGVLRLQAGSAWAPAVALFGLVAAVGLYRLGRRDRPLALLTGMLVAGEVLGLLVLSPEMLHHPMMFNRYLIPVVPVVALWVAVALGAPWRAGRRWQPLALAAVLVVLFASGPLARPFFWQSSFVHHNDFVAFFCPPARLEPDQVPGFYRRVVAGAGDAPVLEYPWHRWWTYMRLYYIYQQVHGQEVLVGLEPPIEHADQLRFRNVLSRNDIPSFLASRARYLVVHTDLPTEEARVQGHCRPILERMKHHHARILRVSGRRMAAYLRQQWGEPDHAGGGALMWDLERIRRLRETDPP